MNQSILNKRLMSLAHILNKYAKKRKRSTFDMNNTEPNEPMRKKHKPTFNPIECLHDICAKNKELIQRNTTLKLQCNALKESNQKYKEMLGQLMAIGQQETSENENMTEQEVAKKPKLMTTRSKATPIAINKPSMISTRSRRRSNRKKSKECAVHLDDLNQSMHDSADCCVCCDTIESTNAMNECAFPKPISLVAKSSNRLHFAKIKASNV
eukprot:838014_1